MQMTTINCSALMIAKATESGGIDCREVFELAGLDPNKLYDTNACHSFRGMSRLSKLAVKLGSDSCIGLKVAHH